MDNMLTPDRLAELTGVRPVTLRDRRRQGLLQGVGMLALPNGGWTSDPEDARLDRKSSRAGDRWHYRPGDALCLAIASQLTDLGLDLAAAMQIAGKINVAVLGWLVGTPKWEAERGGRFLFAWPVTDTEEFRAGRIHPAAGEMEIARTGDLSIASEFVGPKAVFVDLRKMAEAIPTKLKHFLLSIYAE